MDKIDKKTMRKIAFVKVFFMLLCSCSAFAQSSLDGTWKLDSVLIIKNSDSSVVEVSQVKRDIYFGLFDEMLFQGDDLTVIVDGNEMKGSVEITNSKISFTFTPIPIEGEYQIKEGKLLLERCIFHQNSNMYQISTKYKRQ